MTDIDARKEQAIADAVKDFPSVAEVRAQESVQPEQFVSKLELRLVDEPQRLATMVVCSYGEVSQRAGARPERFARGAFTKSVTARGDRIAFTTRHVEDAGKPVPREINVARPVKWEAGDDLELRALVRFYDTPDGWTAFSQARAGELDGGSVGFKAIAERDADGVREVTEAALHHVMLVDRSQLTPAYDSPRLVEVRTEQHPRDLSKLIECPWDESMAEYPAEQVRQLNSRYNGAALGY